MRLLFIQIASVIVGALELMIALLTTLSAASFLSSEQVSENAGWRFVEYFSPNLLENQNELIMFLLVTLAAVVLFKNIINMIQTGISSSFAEQVSARLTGVILTSCVHSEWEKLRKTKLPELQFSLDLTVKIGNMILLAQTTALNFMILVFLMAGCIYVNQEIGMIMMLISLAGFIPVICIRYFATEKVNIRIYNSNKKLYQILYQILHGLMDILFWDIGDALVDSYLQGRKKNCSLKVRQSMFTSAPVAVFEVTMFTALPLLFLYFDQIKKMSSESIMASMALLAAVSWRMLPAANRVTSSFLALKNQMPELFDSVARLKEAGKCLSLLQKEPAHYELDFQKEIRFSRIGYQYDDYSPILSDASFTISKGTITGIIGVSGSGKSTLMMILVQMLHQKSGHIYVDDRELTSDMEKEWRRLIGFVTQPPFLFPWNLAENIGLSDWGTHIDDEAVKHAADLASAGFIEELPEAYGTVLGENGQRLSGGEMQRVAIARALYRDPPILVFDEATSALDHGNEMAILDVLEKLRNQNKTVVMVAHRNEAIKMCDQLIWLDKGQVKASGTSAEIFPLYQKSLDGSLGEFIGNKEYL